MSSVFTLNCAHKCHVKSTCMLECYFTCRSDNESLIETWTSVDFFSKLVAQLRRLSITGVWGNLNNLFWICQKQVPDTELLRGIIRHMVSTIAISLAAKHLLIPYGYCMCICWCLTVWLGKKKNTYCLFSSNSSIIPYRRREPRNYADNLCWILIIPAATSIMFPQSGSENCDTLTYTKDRD